MGINELNFRHQVNPGDILKLEVEVIRKKERGGKY